jgi:hypothetical protein
MKTTLFAFCFLCFTGAAFGQATAATTSSIDSEPQVYEFRSHQGRASQQGMGQEQNLLGVAGYTQAHGVIPLWEVATPSHVMPLGDAARLLKKEHATAKKADTVWNN